jgi:anti-sigma B factor antagonist
MGKQERYMDQLHPQIEVEYVQHAVIATLTDEKILDESDIRGLADSIMPLLEGSGSVNLVLDFSNVKFLTSVILGLLIRISRKIYESEGQFKLCGINPKIHEIFRITRLDRVFDIHADRYDAVRSLD